MLISEYLIDAICCGKNSQPVQTMTYFLRDNRIVIPTSLQRKVVDLAHMGHQGIVKKKALLREKVWFYVKNCLTCQIVTPSFNREPLRMSPLPKGPWTETKYGL